MNEKFIVRGKEEKKNLHMGYLKSLFYSKKRKKERM